MVSEGGKAEAGRGTNQVLGPALVQVAMPAPQGLQTPFLRNSSVLQPSSQVARSSVERKRSAALSKDRNVSLRSEEDAARLTK